MAAFNFGPKSDGSNTPNKGLFGATGTSGATGSSLFGTSGTTASSIFGATSNANSGATSAGTSFTFSNKTDSANTFGAFATKPAGSQSSQLGGNQASGGASQPANNPFALGAPAGSSGGASPKPSIFGAAKGGAGAASTPSFNFSTTSCQ
ncbi:hypothetical protein BDV95DRAFT_270861 [Massariosphaeria phaeospora]|uniref:Uncharacterized protein n=1 Tax=Massariosphaeria phaeospora TaxID=100035 RepID=A0A7C8M1L4_9PLEO|nr:hypothetical protein BDV95DRAFT_270861 [Massariosphaeria phaeospora]